MFLAKLHSNLQKIWFISDLHYGHDKDFILNPRKYPSVNFAMLDILEKLQTTIGPDDIVFDLGDLVVGAGKESEKYARQLMEIPCKAHYFLWGNHNAGVNSMYDKAMRDAGYPELVVTYPLPVNGTPCIFVGDFAEINVDNVNVIMSHYPIEAWPGMHRANPTIMLHGHCHMNLPENPKLFRMDVGWDRKRAPISWKEVSEFMLAKTKEVQT